jgi:hypothetical protein
MERSRVIAADRNADRLGGMPANVLVALAAATGGR